MINFRLKETEGKKEIPQHLPYRKDSHVVIPNVFASEKDAMKHIKKLEKSYTIVKENK